MSALEYWLWLSAADVSPRAKAALVDRFGDAERAFLAPKGAFSRIPGVLQKEAQILERRDKSMAAQIVKDCARQGLEILTLQDARYPARLRSIYAPPVALYVKGELPDVDSEAVISIIGTRRASGYGRRMGLELASQIGRCGGVVLSLLTPGIDAEVARGALRVKCRCIAVLGTAHEEDRSPLTKDVAAHGAVISEYPPTVRAQKRFFRERNRVASGLSVGVVVVEAPEKSGALLFAQEALDQGREVFAVPGNADEENSVGTLGLLKNGAKLVTGARDVIEEFIELFPDKLELSAPPETPAPAADPAGAEASAAKKDVDKENRQGYIDLRAQLEKLDEEELRIVTAISEGASHMDEVIERTGLPTWKVLSKLTKLTIERYLVMRPGKFYELNITKK